MATMKCILCGSDGKVIRGYNSPDQYQVSAGVKTTSRTFHQCPKCEMIWQEDTMDVDALELAYAKYRDEDIRGASVEDEFLRISNITNSENVDRIVWLEDNFAGIDSLLDIGSGLGLFPYAIKQRFDANVICVEPCSESVEFIRQSLGMECLSGMFEPAMVPETVVTSLVHVLEHMSDPIETLKSLKSQLLFIEVPDAREFDYLPPQHDEFNSTHLWFFNVSTLDRMCRMAGWTPYKIERVGYKDRGLERIRVLCSL
jgi:hypothetical protein